MIQDHRLAKVVQRFLQMQGTYSAKKSEENKKAMAQSYAQLRAASKKALMDLPPCISFTLSQGEGYATATQCIANDQVTFLEAAKFLRAMAHKMEQYHAQGLNTFAELNRNPAINTYHKEEFEKVINQ